MPTSVGWRGLWRGGWSRIVDRRVEQEAMVAAKGSAQQRMGVSKRGEAA